MVAVADELPSVRLIVHGMELPEKILCKVKRADTPHGALMLYVVDCNHVI